MEARRRGAARAPSAEGAAIAGPTGTTSPRVHARVAGVGYLVIIAAGILAEFVVRSRVVVPGDAAATAGNIAASEPLFRVALACDLVMLVADVVVAVTL